MHLANKHGTFNPKQAQISIYKQKKTKHTKENPNIHLKPNSNLNMVASISSNKTCHKQMLIYKNPNRASKTPKTNAWP